MGGSASLKKEIMTRMLRQSSQKKRRQVIVPATINCCVVEPGDLVRGSYDNRPGVLVEISFDDDPDYKCWFFTVRYEDGSEISYKRIAVLRKWQELMRFMGAGDIKHLRTNRVARILSRSCFPGTSVPARFVVRYGKKLADAEGIWQSQYCAAMPSRWTKKR